MAILASLPGIEVTINVNNQPLVEYIDDNPNETLGQDAANLGPRTVSRYIESVTNEEFTVEISLAKPYQPTSPSVTFEIYMDGTWVSGVVILTNAQTMAFHQTRSTKGSSTYDPVRKQGTLHHFKFSDIKTTSDEDKLCDIKSEIKRMSKVGMIEVKARRTTTPTSIPRKVEALRLGADNTEVHEKALKGQAKSHGISSGRTSTVTTSTASHVDYLDDRRQPSANFVFQYRSKEALKQLYIIERTPSPEPLVISPAREIPRTRVKRERDENNNIKAESQAKRSKYKTTIDLTGDSSDDDGSIVTLE